MKKLLAAAAASAVAFVAPCSFADHRVEVVGYGGVELTGDLPIESEAGAAHASFDAAPAYGGLVAFRAQPNGFAYLSYSRMQTTAYFRSDVPAATDGQADVSIEHLQVGGNLEIVRGRLVPYLGLSLGATRIAPLDTSGDDWSFSMTLDGGVKFQVVDFLHLRLIARMPLSFVGGDSSALCVSGRGCAFHYSGDPLIQAQFLLGAGLQF